MTGTDRPCATGLREAVEALRGGAVIRVGLMKGEDAATMRGWIAACDEMLSLLADHAEARDCDCDYWHGKHRWHCSVNYSEARR